MNTLEEIETRIEENLVNNGWAKEDIACIVFDPELEIWVWTSSPAIPKNLGFGGTYKDMIDVLITNGFSFNRAR